MIISEGSARYSGNQDKPVIAIIEDDAIQRALLVTSLERSGYLVWGAESAEEYYRRAIVSPSSIVIADVGLPGEDGLSLISHLSTRKDLGLICITGDKNLETEFNAWRSGVHMYFTKPLDIKKVITAVQVLWERLRHVEQDLNADKNVWVLDAAHSCLFSPDEEIIALTQNELNFMKILTHRPMEVVSNDSIVALMYGGDEDGKHRVEMLVNRLRKKFRKLNVVLPIRSVFGKGRVFSESVVVQKKLHKRDHDLAG